MRDAEAERGSVAEQLRAVLVENQSLLASAQAADDKWRASIKGIEDARDVEHERAKARDAELQKLQEDLSLVEQQLQATKAEHLRAREQERVDRERERERERERDR